MVPVDRPRAPFAVAAARGADVACAITVDAGSCAPFRGVELGRRGPRGVALRG